jgi:preprotein translocase subunit SecA
MATKVGNYGEKTWRQTEKAIVLQLLDQSWKEHLLALDHLRQGINLRAFGQKDPLNEYKAEAFEMFETMLDSLRETVTQTLCMVEIGVDENRLSLILPGVMGGGRDAAEPEFQETRDDPAMEGIPGQGRVTEERNNVEQMRQRPVENKFDAADPETWTKVPRNAACPCGSGKKFKHCHGSLRNVVSS